MQSTIKSKQSLFKRFDDFLKTLIFCVDKDQCLLRASSLTYHTVLSIVPLLAVTFGIAKGFGIEQALDQSLRTEFKDQEEVLNYLIRFGTTLLSEAQGSIIAGVGILALFFTVIMLMSTIEVSLNHIFDQEGQRPIMRKINDFLAFVVVAPVLFILSGSITLYISTNLKTIGEQPNWLSHISLVSDYIIFAIPYVTSTLLFMFLYLFLPYKEINKRSALLAAICAGVSYQILQATYISLQLQISRTGAIYGSFAALPLFLMWLYLSWIIFLIGAEIAVIHQDRLWDETLLSPFYELSIYEKELLFIAIAKISCDTLVHNSQGILPIELSKNLHIHPRLAVHLAEELCEKKVLIKTHEGSYSPAKSADSMRISDVIQETEDGKVHEDEPTFQKIRSLSDLYDKMLLHLKSAPENELLVNLVFEKS